MIRIVVDFLHNGSLSRILVKTILLLGFEWLKAAFQLRVFHTRVHAQKSLNPSNFLILYK